MSEFKFRFSALGKKNIRLSILYISNIFLILNIEYLNNLFSSEFKSFKSE